MAVELNFESVVSMIENMITGIGVFELHEGRITPVYLNEGLSRMLGYSITETKMAFKNVRNSIIPDDLPVLDQAIKDVLRDDGAVDFELRTVTLSGSMRWLQVRANLYARKDNVYTVIAVLMDATERKNIEEELKQQAERLNMVLAAEGEKIMDYNAKTDVCTIRDASNRITRSEIIINDYVSRFDESVIFAEDVEAFKQVIELAMKSPKHDSVEIRTKQFDDDFRWYQYSITSMAGVEGYVSRIVGRIVNIDDRKKKELELKLKAEKDALTGIFNKGATEQLVRKVLEEEDPESGKLHALMIVDLDNFKAVNDTLGHAKGDQVLIDAADKLSKNFKGSDIVGRIGGDEFFVFMRDINKVTNAELLAGRLCKELKQSFPSMSGDINVSSSIGISVYPIHGLKYSDLFKKADKALYETKARGKNGYTVFDEGSEQVTYKSDRKSVYSVPGLKVKEPAKAEEAKQGVLFSPAEKDLFLDSVLAAAAKECDAQRAFVFKKNATAVKGTYSRVCYLTDGYNAVVDAEQDKAEQAALCDAISIFYKEFGAISASDIVKPEARAYFEKHNVQSVLYYPFKEGEECVGAIIFENCESEQFPVSDEQLKGLRNKLRLVDTVLK